MSVKPNVITLGPLHLFAEVTGGDSPANPSSLAEGAEQARKIGLVKNEGVVEAYYPVGPNPHNHHLQEADGEIACAAWGVAEGTRQKYQEDDNKDETLK